MPEGYFDNLTQNIMNSVEAADKVVPHVPEPILQNKVITINWWHRCRRYAAVAACVAFIVGGVSVWQFKSTADTGKTHIATATHHSTYDASAYNSVSDEEINYSMLDNQDMYTLMASN
ncbi:hypothetical protein [Prevotella sp.]|uniref:hypothetical protein n=1 Tax=Prevotella sp. TaxID=59823 RepID=UPI00402954B1